MRLVTPELLDEITHRLVSALEPEEIILFGSYAWGEPHTQSDVDLLIIVPDGIPNFDRIEWVVKALEAIDGLPVPFDVLVRPRSVAERASSVPASLAVANPQQSFMKSL